MTTSDQRHAYTIRLDEAELGMLPEHRQRRRLNAARRLARYHVASKARQLGMAADEWQERTIEGREDASLAVRVSARLTARDITPPPTVTFASTAQHGPDLDAGGILDRHQQAIAADLDEHDPPRFGDGGEDLATFQNRINDLLVGQIHAQENYGIPARFLVGQTSAEAFREWEAPKRAIYEAARDAAMARLEPAFEQLGRMIENLVNPPQIITIDEEHHITADQLEQIRPGRIWMTGTNAGPADTERRSIASRYLADTERRSLASRYLAALGHPLDGHAILGLEQVFTQPNLDPVRSWMADAYPAMRDPSGPQRCTCGDVEWTAGTPAVGFIRSGGWAHRINGPCHRMIVDRPEA